MRFKRQTQSRDTEWLLKGKLENCITGKKQTNPKTSHSIILHKGPVRIFITTETTCTVYEMYVSLNMKKQLPVNI